MTQIGHKDRYSGGRIALSFSAWWIAILGLVVLSGCGKPFNVKSRIELPHSSYAETATGNRVSVRAGSITNEDLLYEAFDANLIVAGVFPVRITLTNTSDDSVDLKKTRFTVNTQNSRSFKSLNARDAFQRLISYYEIQAYNKAGYKESLGDFVSYALDITKPLAARESRDGVLFFPLPADVARSPGLTLSIVRLDQKDSPIVLKLN